MSFLCESRELFVRNPSAFYAKAMNFSRSHSHVRKPKKGELDVLRAKATKRNLSLKIFDFQTPETVGGSRVQQVVKLRKGLSQEIAKKLSKIVRDELKKVTVAIQGESVRITGKSKDDLQAAIQLVKSKEDELDVPLQFENYR